MAVKPITIEVHNGESDGGGEEEEKNRTNDSKERTKRMSNSRMSHLKQVDK